MSSGSKWFSVLAVSCGLLGCATGGTESSGASNQAADMKMAGASCMNQATSSRQECEQKCPKATGSEHFSMQHKLAMEYSACAERCAAEMESEAMQCKANR